MVSGPAGMRCADCGKFKFAAAAQELDPSRLVSALAAGLVSAVAFSYIMAYIFAWVGLLICLVGPVYGWLVGEVIRRFAGRQKPLALQAAGIGCTLVGLAIVFLIEFGGPKPLPVTLPQISWPMFGLAITLAVSACYRRLKR